MQIRIPIQNDIPFAQILDDFADLNIAVFSSKRLKRTWRLEKKIDKYSLIIPDSFIDAPDDIKKALIRWAKIIIEQKFNRRYANITIKRQIKELEDIIHDFIKNELGIDNRKVFSAPHTRFRYTDGHQFDLTEIFDKLNKKYFCGELKCFLRWGREGSRTSYHTICSDENGDSFHLITIAGTYNLLNIPEFAIESVMYHEMLHIAYPPKICGIQRNVHHKQFREKERQFPYYEKWKAWQKKFWTKKVF